MIRQLGSMDEFVKKLKMLTSRMTNNQYMGLFMGDLKEEIWLEVQTLDPPTGCKAISMAQNV